MNYEKNMRILLVPKSQSILKKIGKSLKTGPGSFKSIIKIYFGDLLMQFLTGTIMSWSLALPEHLLVHLEDA